MEHKILIIEDSDDTREMMAKLLELESFTVVTARNGQSGIEQASSERPDLIITDINMPILNGIEMTRRLRAEPELKAIPILALTAYGDNLANEAIKAGANQVAIKPLEFDALIEAIKRLLRNSKGNTCGV